MRGDWGLTWKNLEMTHQGANRMGWGWEEDLPLVYTLEGTFCYLLRLCRYNWKSGAYLVEICCKYKIFSIEDLCLKIRKRRRGG